MQGLINNGLIKIINGRQKMNFPKLEFDQSTEIRYDIVLNTIYHLCNFKKRYMQNFHKKISISESLII